jgi:hypothetical protein
LSAATYRDPSGATRWPGTTQPWPPSAAGVERQRDLAAAARPEHRINPKFRTDAERGAPSRSHSTTS